MINWLVSPINDVVDTDFDGAPGYCEGRCGVQYCAVYCRGNCKVDAPGPAGLL